ncbi:MAG: peptidase C60 family protein [Anaerolineales bacterium]|nr:peptidase C60 family protein [Anaerolineales bacterium]
MRDQRPVDSISTEELEQITRLRRRTARAEKLRAMAQRGRLVGESPLLSSPESISQSAPVRRRWRVLDYLLLLVELGANVLRTLNQEVAAALTLPTLTSPSPTALITPLYLPDSHTPPTSPGGAQPYEASLPESIRYLVTPAPPSFLPALPTPAPEQPRRMIIPAINVDAPVVQGVGWEQLKKGIGQVPGTALPGQVGNSVYAAHNDIYGELFRHLDQLKPGDEVRVYTASQEFRYIVREWRIVEPTEVSVMDPTPTTTLTLISCYPYLVDTQRIIVFADLTTGDSGR